MIFLRNIMLRGDKVKQTKPINVIIHGPTGKEEIDKLQEIYNNIFVHTEQLFLDNTNWSVSEKSRYLDALILISSEF